MVERQAFQAKAILPAVEITSLSLGLPGVVGTAGREVAGRAGRETAPPKEGEPEARTKEREAERQKAPTAPEKTEIQKALKELNARLPKDIDDADRKVVLDMAGALLKGDRDSLDKLNQTCCDYEKNPEALKKIFGHFAKLWKGLNLGEIRIDDDRDADGRVVTMDIPLGDDNYLRFGSRPGSGGFVVHRFKAVARDGELRDAQEISRLSSPYGAGLRISRDMVEAIKKQP